MAYLMMVSAFAPVLNEGAAALPVPLVTLSVMSSRIILTTKEQWRPVSVAICILFGATGELFPIYM